MARLMVLGEGWVGSAVARHAQAALLGENPGGGPQPGATEAGATEADPTQPDATQAHATESGVIVLDPPLVPELAARDLAASRHMSRILAESGVDTVINACGLTRGSRDELEDANVAFPRWLCDVLADSAARLVHVGSASEVGDPGSASPVTEEVGCDPVGDYATTKHQGTEVVLDARANGLDAVVARVFNIAGHPVSPVSPIHQWLTDLRGLVPGGGEVDVWWPATIRDFVAIGDVAAALVDLGEVDRPPGLVNVCSGVPLAYGDIVATLAATLGIEVVINSLERPGIEAVVGDPALLRATLGRVPSMSLQRLASSVLPGGNGASNL